MKNKAINTMDCRSSPQYRSYKRRTKALVAGYNMKWSGVALDLFVIRLCLASCDEGVDDCDLIVLVRMYNRELIGEKQWNSSSQ